MSIESALQLKGLTQLEAEKRFLQYGANEVASKPKLSGIIFFLLRFNNPLVIVLLFAAVISAFFNDWISSVLIVIIILLSVLMDFFNTYRSEKAAETLKNRVRVTTLVVRDGNRKEIPLSEIVPGDLVMLSPGDIIPADGKVIHARDFFVNESSLTGESFPVEKMPEDVVYMGCSVITGNGRILVVSTGKSTKFGKITESLVKKEEMSDFDRGIQEFSLLLMKVTFTLVILVFFANAFLKHNILESFLFASALAVGLTPELLPMIIAINLSKGSVVMARRGVIVKRLSAIQNFGSMDILCTDKTGTLTEDRIVLVKCVDSEGNPSENVFLNAYISSHYNGSFKNPLDTAIEDYRELDVTEYQKIDEIPFDYGRKKESIIVDYHKGHGQEKERILISKGAPEEIISSCAYFSAERKTDASTVFMIGKQYQELSKGGFRVLAISTKKLTGEKERYSKEDEGEMEFAGFIAFLDPPKKTVSETIKSLEHHGIKIKILTGDNELLTKKIANDIELAVEGVLLGSDLDKITDEALRIHVEKTTIFARVSPDQKVRIIRALRKNGHVVGYLGDGINDAPSLRAADVGVSVYNAVDVAKDSADLVLLKKSLVDLVRGVIEGRKIFVNIHKYLMMELSSNFGNMFSMAGASFLFPFLPMLPVQVLLDNLLYDTSQFTIPVDNVDIDMIMKPRKLNVKFIGWFMVCFGLLSSCFDFITFGLLFFIFHLNSGGFQTAWFFESLLTQTLIISVLRTQKIPFVESRPSKIVLASMIGVIVVGAYFVFGDLMPLFGFVSLPWTLIPWILVIAFVYMVTVEAVKPFFYKKFGYLMEE